MKLTVKNATSGVRIDGTSTWGIGPQNGPGSCAWVTCTLEQVSEIREAFKDAEGEDIKDTIKSAIEILQEKKSDSAELLMQALKAFLKI